MYYIEILYSAWAAAGGRERGGPTLRAAWAESLARGGKARRTVSSTGAGGAAGAEALGCCCRAPLPAPPCPRPAPAPGLHRPPHSSQVGGAMCGGGTGPPDESGSSTCRQSAAAARRRFRRIQKRWAIPGDCSAGRTGRAGRGAAPAAALAAATSAALACRSAAFACLHPPAHQNVAGAGTIELQARCGGTDVPRTRHSLLNGGGEPR